MTKAYVENGIKVIEPHFAPWQYLAIYNPFTHFSMFNGIATGKTFTGAHYAIYHIQKYPYLTGFIGANTYDQLSQATLKELFYWFDHYGITYVIDKKPPKEWGAPKLKTYHNVLTVFYNGKPTIIFTRVMSNVDSLRGMEFSWYWLDETRDTKEYGHDVVLSRMRESDYMKGLITTTTAGEDWAYKRFTKNAKPNDATYGSMHVPTIKSVEYGIITQAFYDTLLSSYSEQMALQELWAKHVNVSGGRAYHAAGLHNKLLAAPWGDTTPSPNRTLVIGCDFNYQPAPCMWMVGQVGPDLIDHRDGIMYSDKIHWFDCISDVEMSTPDMVRKLVATYPGFFYQVFGDASGNRGTNSNAGETDYIQMGNTFDDLNCHYSIDADQANPMVKDRVETMNAMFKNGMGQVRQTYNPVKCHYFDSDVNQVGWTQNNNGETRGKLSNGGEIDLTHATDGAGYAVYKLFPIGRRAHLVESNISTVANEVNTVV